MNLEQTLTDELASVATGIDVPPPPAVAAVVQQAEQSRTRSRVRWTATTLLAAAAVVAAVVVGNQIGRPNAAPSPTGPTSTATMGTFPLGSPLRTYVDPAKGTLYIDGTPQPGAWSDAVTLGGLTLGYGRTTSTDGATDIGVFRGTERIGVLHDVAGPVVKVSPNARTIAWVEDHHTTGVIVVADVTRSAVHELGRLSAATLVAKPDDESGEQLITVGDDGTVTYGGVTSGHAWRPGGAPRATDISSLMYGPTGFPSRAEEVRLDPTGSWGAWLTDARDPAAGGGFASWGAVTFQQPGRPATKATLRMPAGFSDVRDLYWESDTDVVLDISSGDTSTELITGHVRCSVLTRRCESAPTPGSP
ncbi:hypothetical protein [Nocardioides pocheonensis]|uniref:Uncharacterized protein n=1 Tax=Nocardioides pocheonensis TaxID=661485 RepID=A0A3N0GJT2_9ACTN|nr:hypothetical protein [Nocardioides pocheonensis]RNM12713.1 hypothetical protein EFL26_19165 [Nocardioides pocheonensis]